MHAQSMRRAGFMLAAQRSRSVSPASLAKAKNSQQWQKEVAEVLAEARQAQVRR